MGDRRAGVQVDFAASLADNRECLDDGVLFALLLAPLIASGLLHDAMQRLSNSTLRPRPWRIEDPLVLPTTPIRNIGGILPESSEAIKALSALAISRRNLVQLFTLCSFVLLVHLARSLHFSNELNQSSPATMEREISDSGRPRGGLGQYWLKRGELRRTRSVVVFAFVVTAVCILFKIATAYVGRGVWSGESAYDLTNTRYVRIRYHHCNSILPV